MHKYLIGLAVAVIVLEAVIGGAGWAQGERDAAGERVWLRPLVLVLRPPTETEKKGIVDQMDLNESQKRQLAELEQEFEDSARTLQARHQQLLRRLAAFMTAPPVERGTVRKKVTSKSYLNKEKLANELVSKGINATAVVSAIAEATEIKEIESIEFRMAKD